MDQVLFAEQTGLIGGCARGRMAGAAWTCPKQAGAPANRGRNMQLLESALAFAVVMIVLSTVTTGIVELLLRFSGTREKTLEKTMKALFQTVIWPRLKGPLITAAGKAEDVVKRELTNAFVREMMGNPVAIADESDSKRRFFDVPVRKESQVDKLSVLAFAERLGRTDVGKAILDEGEEQLQLLVHDFVRTFDRFARASSEIFRKKARQTAIVVGVLFALAANVDAGRIFTTLMNNPDLRSSLIEQVEEAKQANDEVVARLAALEAELESGGLQDEQSQEIKKNIDELSARMKALDATGLPIGHSFFPYCGEDAAGDPACGKGGGDYLLEFARWIALAVLAGVLIGLGGPFWFRVFSGLSQVFQVLRSLGVGSGGKGENAGEADVDKETMPPPDKSAQPKDVIDAFKVAVRVHAHRPGVGRRRVLNPDGQPL